VSPPTLPVAREASTWAYVPVATQYNADVARMFDAGTYLSPRPQTCGVRIGTDGWSAWTFPWWGSPVPPKPDLTNLANISIGGGAIVTPQVCCVCVCVCVEGGLSFDPGVLYRRMRSSRCLPPTTREHNFSSTPLSVLRTSRSLPCGTTTLRRLTSRCRRVSSLRPAPCGYSWRGRRTRCR
jgi:hypothetical protein